MKSKKLPSLKFNGEDFYIEKHISEGRTISMSLLNGKIVVEDRDWKWYYFANTQKDFDKAMKKFESIN
jgi:hypothetical protein